MELTHSVKWPDLTRAARQDRQFLDGQRPQSSGPLCECSLVDNVAILSIHRKDLARVILE